MHPNYLPHCYKVEINTNTNNDTEMKDECVEEYIRVYGVAEFKRWRNGRYHISSISNLHTNRNQ